jgi:hypothetical protein
MQVMKGKGAQVNRRISHLNLPCSHVMLRVEHPISHYHFSLPMRFLLNGTDINCTSNSVHICTAGHQPLLRAPRFAQRHHHHNNNRNDFEFKQVENSLVFNLLPKPHSICYQRCPAASTVCATCTLQSLACQKMTMSSRMTC